MKQFSPRKLSYFAGATDTYCGQHYTIVKTNTGQVYGCGDNKFHQLSQQETSQLLEPVILSGVKTSDSVSCGWTHLVTESDGCVHVRGRNNYDQQGGADTGPVISGVRSAVAGSEHCLCLMTTGALVTWGWNEHGNCGLGHTDSVPAPAQVNLDNVSRIFAGSAHCFALTSL